MERPLNETTLHDYRNGRWIAVEVKLGQHPIDEGVKNLLALRGRLAASVADHCGALVVVGANTPTYTRPDGVIVTSVAALGS